MIPREGGTALYVPGHSNTIRYGMTRVLSYADSEAMRARLFWGDFGRGCIHTDGVIYSIYIHITDVLEVC